MIIILDQIQNNIQKKDFQNFVYKFPVLENCE